ncbi:uncharacterized protein [Aristolochia californica]|uniref:uncharacterized protein n=1 Tax=Aristolochia californica TaxID=171875 RepID=UPI0035E39A5B
MGEANLDVPQRLQIPAQRLVTDLTSPVPPNPENPSKSSFHFLFRSLFVVVIIAVLPLLPPQAPEFINQTIFTRSWELLHLLLVGIAVSYGVFSRRNLEMEKESLATKPDNVQSYVSKILQVSSVFDDEIENQSGYDDSKIQTWNHQYFRGDPMVVVSEENGMGDVNKPLLLPVRSLKSRVSDPETVDSVDRSYGSSVKMGALNCPERMMITNDEFGAMDNDDFEENLEETVVRPSPIPWRSRSERIEVKDDELGSLGAASPPLYSLPPAMNESNFDRFESHSHHSPLSFTRQNSSTTPSPKKLSPSPSLSPEFRGKNGEDSMKKKGPSYRSPPPPPPPPPPFSYKSQPYPVNSSLISPKETARSPRETRRSPRDEGKDLNRSSRENLNNFSTKDLGSQPFRLDMKAKSFNEGLMMGISNSGASRDTGNHSFRSESKTKQYSESSPPEKPDSWGSKDLGSQSFRLERKSKLFNEGLSIGRQDSWGSKDSGSESFRSETRAKHYTEGNPVAKSVRTVRSNSGGGAETNSSGKKPKEVESVAMETAGSNGYEKPSREIPRPPPKYPKKEPAEKVIVESDHSEDESFTSNYYNEEDAASASVAEGASEENEVDKKADEFIAKFREQIRLQRIESIKRSTRQRTSRSST